MFCLLTYNQLNCRVAVHPLNNRNIYCKYKSDAFLGIHVLLIITVVFNLLQTDRTIRQAAGTLTTPEGAS